MKGTIRLFGGGVEQAVLAFENGKVEVTGPQAVMVRDLLKEPQLVFEPEIDAVTFESKPESWSWLAGAAWAWSHGEDALFDRMEIEGDGIESKTK